MDSEGYRQQARETYASDDIEIDDNAKVSTSEEGAFIQAWVWIGKDE